ncbi:MAG: MFS transporter [Thermoplasmata archaeon]|nr:MFS transporter [Thermoplasmata archaeon]
MAIPRDRMYLKFRLYGFLKNLRFFDPFILLFFMDAGLSFLSIGLLYAIREIFINIFELPTGFLADTFGRRKSMILSFSFCLAAFLIFYIFPGFWFYALAMVFLAAGEAFRSGTHKAMILDYLKLRKIEHKKVEYYGRTRSASQLGSAISALIAIVLVIYTGDYRIVFLASTIPYVAELFLMASYPAYLDGDIARGRERTRAGLKNSFSDTWRSFVSIFKSRNAMRGIMNSSVFGGVFRASKEYLQPVLEAQAIALPVFLYLVDQERIAILVGLTYFFLYLMTSLTSRSAGRIASKLSEVSRGINTTFVIGAALLIISGFSTYMGWYPVAVASFIGLYIIHNIRRPMNVGYISDTIPSKVMATGLSVESQVKSMVTAVFAPLIGYLADVYGVGQALAVVGIIYLALLPIVAVRKAEDKL